MSVSSLTAIKAISAVHSFKYNLQSCFILWLEKEKNTILKRWLRDLMKSLKLKLSSMLVKMQRSVNYRCFPVDLNFLSAFQVLWYFLGVWCRNQCWKSFSIIVLYPRQALEKWHCSTNSHEWAKTRVLFFWLCITLTLHIFSHLFWGPLGQKLWETFEEI